MADNTQKVGKADRDRINVDEAYELRDWAEHFGVTTEQIPQCCQRSRLNGGGRLGS